MLPESTENDELAAISVHENDTKTNHVEIPQDRVETSIQNENCAKMTASVGNDSGVDSDARSTKLGTKRRSSSTKARIPRKSNADGAGGELEDKRTMSNFEVIIKNSQQFCSKWDGMRLGKKTGTAALNNYLEHVIGNKGRSGDRDTFSQYTAVQMSQMFDTLFPKCISKDSHEVSLFALPCSGSSSFSFYLAQTN